METERSVGGILSWGGYCCECDHLQRSSLAAYRNGKIAPNALLSFKQFWVGVLLLVVVAGGMDGGLVGLSSWR